MSVDVVTVGQTEVVVTVTPDPTIEIQDSQSPITVEVQLVGAQGPAAPDTFETVAANLGAYPHDITYTGGKVTSIVYNLPGSLQITKTLNYTGDQLDSIVLSGDTPNGIDLTKTLTYTDGVLSSVNYS